MNFLVTASISKAVFPLIGEVLIDLVINNGIHPLAFSILKYQ